MNIWINKRVFVVLNILSHFIFEVFYIFNHFWPHPFIKGINKCVYDFSGQIIP